MYFDLIESCKDQNSSRMIQKQFESSSIEQKNIIFQKIYQEALNLMKDQFGNYVIQKFFEKGQKKKKLQKQIYIQTGNTEHKIQLYQLLKGQVLDLSLHTYGCRVIQKALEELKDYPELQEGIIQEINDKIMVCIQDQHGNHVIQKCFETISSSKQINLHFIHTVVEQFREYQNCVLPMKQFFFLITLYIWKQKKTKEIYDKLMENIIDLCKCQYGNYIIQYIIEKGSNYYKQKMLKIIKENFVCLSLNKFASNVTEKSILFSDDSFKLGVLDVLLSQFNNQSQDTGIIKLTKNAYGNYVVQRFYEKSNFDIKQKLCAYLLQNELIYNDIVSNSYGKPFFKKNSQNKKIILGKHVLTHIEKNRVDNIRNNSQNFIQNNQFSNSKIKQKKKF
ncbi:pumilio-family RNA binding repeat protein [Ichthyophthirius multifiliis]|uniref:Pumilio-family RNA binding repeat protein n=1 Tax=Ichthyophthirius multifiliis TaxID=5932 RepID=G0QJJ7_ICHMU|nr:pumilio-family RNA binding repeat protein [Ichthyophthirius multifiliis]EGR34598.1 pumilio-family RNA binding repeat protein [Ichthyophthirius multifiliis]|eukprot:XP_004039902.1 pumilio-family RNA binding repeat protein [Ichthyophthirius multifiliis]